MIVHTHTHTHIHEIECTEDACTCTYILCGSLGLVVLYSWGTCFSSHFISHSILFCGHPHLEISSLHLQVHSTPEPLRWRGETRRRFFSWYGAVLPIRWVSKTVFASWKLLGSRTQTSMYTAHVCMLSVHHLCSHVTAPSTLSPLLQRVCMALSLHLSTV